MYPCSPIQPISNIANWTGAIHDRGMYAHCHIHVLILIIIGIFISIVIPIHVVSSCPSQSHKTDLCICVVDHLSARQVGTHVCIVNQPFSTIGPGAEHHRIVLALQPP